MQEFFRLLSLENAELSPPVNNGDVFQLPGVHFAEKPYPLAPLEVTLPSRWTDYARTLGSMLDIDFYLVIAFILHESGGQYHSLYPDVLAYAEQSGADINNLFDPLENITIGMMMLNEQRKLCKDPADMREWVGRQGEGYHSASTLEILYYRDQLAKQDGLEPWYSDDFYSSQMLG